MSKELCIDSYELGIADAFSSLDTRPATRKQKKLMRKLGLKIRKDMTLVEAKIRISAVLEAKSYFGIDMYPDDWVMSSGENW